MVPVNNNNDKGNDNESKKDENNKAYANCISEIEIHDIENTRHRALNGIPDTLKVSIGDGAPDSNKLHFNQYKHFEPHYAQRKELEYWKTAKMNHHSRCYLNWSLMMARRQDTTKRNTQLTTQIRNLLMILV